MIFRIVPGEATATLGVHRRDRFPILKAFVLAWTRETGGLVVYRKLRTGPERPGRRM
jgi:hypothetical protein